MVSVNQKYINYLSCDLYSELLVVLLSPFPLVAPDVARLLPLFPFLGSRDEDLNFPAFELELRYSCKMGKYKLITSNLINI